MDSRNIQNGEQNIHQDQNTRDNYSSIDQARTGENAIQAEKNQQDRPDFQKKGPDLIIPPFRHELRAQERYAEKQDDDSTDEPAVGKEHIQPRENQNHRPEFQQNLIRQEIADQVQRVKLQHNAGENCTYRQNNRISDTHNTQLNCNNYAILNKKLIIGK